MILENDEVNTPSFEVTAVPTLVDISFDSTTGLNKLTEPLNQDT